MSWIRLLALSLLCSIGLTLLSAFSSLHLKCANLYGSSVASVPAPLPAQAAVPLSESDLPAFAAALKQSLNVSPDSFQKLSILTIRHTPTMTYLLYHLPKYEGLAVACKTHNQVRLLKPLVPVKHSGAPNDLVSVEAIPAGSAPDPSYGVLFGIVNSPSITQIDVRYRDSQVDRADVAHSRGFIFLRKNQDPRYVQISALSKGVLLWTKDTR